MAGLDPAFRVPGDVIVGLAAALGSGLLIRLERERHKKRGPHREPAGLRTFTLAAMGGALCQALQAPGLLAAGALAIAALAVSAHLRSRGRDPGLTTGIALLVTYLIGALCVTAPLLGSPAAVVLTTLLAARTRLHRFATQVLREEELHDGLRLAFACNSTTRAITAVAAGGWRFARFIIPALPLLLGAGLAALLCGAGA